MSLFQKNHRFLKLLVKKIRKNIPFAVVLFFVLLVFGVLAVTQILNTSNFDLRQQAANDQGGAGGLYAPTNTPVPTCRPGTESQASCQQFNQICIPDGNCWKPKSDPTVTSTPTKLISGKKCTDGSQCQSNYCSDSFCQEMPTRLYSCRENESCPNPAGCFCPTTCNYLFTPWKTSCGGIKPSPTPTQGLGGVCPFGADSKINCEKFGEICFQNSITKCWAPKPDPTKTPTLTPVPICQSQSQCQKYGDICTNIDGCWQIAKLEGNTCARTVECASGLLCSNKICTHVNQVAHCYSFNNCLSAGPPCLCIETNRNSDNTCFAGDYYTRLQCEQAADEHNKLMDGTCTPGETICVESNGEAFRQSTCKADGKSWESKLCSAGQICSNNKCISEKKQVNDPCSRSSDCATGLACQKDRDGTYACLPSATVVQKKANGQSCTSNTQCVSNLCRSCQTGELCPDQSGKFCFAPSATSTPAFSSICDTGYGVYECQGNTQTYCTGFGLPLIKTECGNKGCNLKTGKCNVASCAEDGQKKLNAECCSGSSYKVKTQSGSTEVMCGISNAKEGVEQGQCYFGASSCLTFGRYPSTSCSSCPSGIAACCGSVIPESAKICTPYASTCTSSYSFKMCSSLGTEYTTGICAPEYSCVDDSCHIKMKSPTVGDECFEPHGALINDNIFCCSGVANEGQCSGAVEDANGATLPDESWCNWGIFGSCRRCKGGVSYVDLEGKNRCGKGSACVGQTTIGTKLKLERGNAVTTIGGCYSCDVNGNLSVQSQSCESDTCLQDGVIKMENGVCCSGVSMEVDGNEKCTSLNYPQCPASIVNSCSRISTENYFQSDVFYCVNADSQSQLMMCPLNSCRQINNGDVCESIPNCQFVGNQCLQIELVAHPEIGVRVLGDDDNAEDIIRNVEDVIVLLPAHIIDVGLRNLVIYTPDTQRSFDASSPSLCGFVRDNNGEVNLNANCTCQNDNISEFEKNYSDNDPAIIACNQERDSAVVHVVIHEVYHSTEDLMIESDYCPKGEAQCASFDSFIEASEEDGISFTENGRAIGDYFDIYPANSVPDYELYAEFMSMCVTNPAYVEENYPNIYAMCGDLNGVKYEVQAQSDGSHEIVPVNINN